MSKIYLLLVFGGIILTFGDIIMKRWAIGSGFVFYIVAMLLYIISLTMLGLAYKTENLAIASIVMVMINSITLIFVGIFLYKETFSIKQIIGIVLAISSMIFLGI